MAQIQATTGLATGIDIIGTVDALMKLAAKSRNSLYDRTEVLKQEQAAITELAALFSTTRYLNTNLGKADVYEARKATSSNEAALTATATGKVATGTYQFTPVKVAQSAQWLSAGVKSNSASLGAGTVTFRFGDTVERSTPLEVLNGGQGFVRGKIRITDHSGASAEIDLTTAQTLDDILNAINSNTRINVTASADGDRIRLTDNTGLANANLMVQEVSGGATAASLGLAGINSDQSTVVGDDIVRLSRNTELDSLNDGSGIRTNPALPDIRYQLRDGTAGMIDFSPLAMGGSGSKKETTLGELIDVINNTAPGKLKAEIGPDGDRLVLTDLTTGDKSFTLESLYESDALKALGLDQAADDGTITGRRILGGLQSVLVSSLNGGKGYGELGRLDLTDRNGAQATVDLSNAETLDEVINTINSAGIGIRAQLNPAKTGLELVDTTGNTEGAMVVANGDDGLATATKLGIAVAAEANASSVKTGDMHLRVISYNTKLDDLNAGRGIARGTITIIDSSGKKATLDLGDKEKYQTIGDVIKGINLLDLQVYADLNATGDGIQIRDLAGGSGKLQVLDSETAQSLHLVGTATDTTVDGVATQILSGSSTYKIEITADDTIETLASKINALGAGISASIFQDGSSRPYRLSLTSDQSGTIGEFVLDTSALGLSMDKVADGQDALLAVGFGSGSGQNLLVSSSSNTFENVIDGMKLQVKQASATPVSVAVTSDSTSLVATMKTFVENYNKFRKRLTELTKYNADLKEKALLASDSTALRLDADISTFLSSRFLQAGSIQSLGELGISFNDDGTLTLDEAKLKNKFDSDLAGVRDFFTTKNTGFAAKFAALSEQLTGQNVSLVAQRYISLGTQIDNNTERISDMDERLVAQRNRLLLQYYNLETLISKLHSSMDVIERMEPLKPYSGRND